MPVAIGIITLGIILAYSGITGHGITDVIAGSGGRTLNPAGGTRSFEDPTTATTDTAPVSSNPVSSGSFPANPVNTLTGGDWTAPPGGSHSFKGPNADLLNELAGVAQNTYGLRITATTNGVHVPGSYHGQERAFDAAGPETQMRAYASYVSSRYREQTLELIHNPGYAIKNGVVVDGAVVYAAVWLGHRDHVHVAM